MFSEERELSSTKLLQRERQDPITSVSANTELRRWVVRINLTGIRGQT